MDKVYTNIFKQMFFFVGEYLVIKENKNSLLEWTDQVHLPCQVSDDNNRTM